MEKKKLAQTNGVPLIFGLIGSGILLVAIITYCFFVSDMMRDISNYYVNTMSRLGAPTDALTSIFSTLTPIMYVFIVVGYLAYPGIFLILLLIGANKPRRGMAFGVVWLIIASLSAVETLTNTLTFSLGSSSNSIYSQLFSSHVRAGMITVYCIQFLGSAAILISSIAFLSRLGKIKPEYIEPVYPQPYYQPNVYQYPTYPQPMYPQQPYPQQYPQQPYSPQAPAQPVDPQPVNPPQPEQSDSNKPPEA
jgi:energy-converting hydrogenase Eha subunit A